MIIIQQRLVPIYKENLFDAIIKQLSDVIVVYGQQNKSERIAANEITKKGYYKVKNIYLLKNKYELYYQNIFKILFIYKPNIIITASNLGNLSIYIFLFFKFFFNYRIIFWGHGWNRAKGFNHKKNLIDRFRIILYNKADMLLLYSDNAKEILKNYLPHNKMEVASNTIDTIIQNNILLECKRIGKNKLKSELGLESEYNIVFLGKLVKDKEPDKLLDIFKILKDELRSISLYFIGSGCYEEKLLEKVKSDNIQDVIFMGEILDQKKLGQILYSCDAMVIPGYIGLAIIHAFCFELPIFTQSDFSSPFSHSPEIDYLVNGQNSFIIKYNDIQEFKNKIIEYLNNKKLQKKIKNNIRYTLENKASFEGQLLAFLNVIKKLQ